MKNLYGILGLSLLLIIVLSGCGEDAFTADGSTNTNTGTNTGTGTGTGTVVTVSIGSGTGGSFTVGSLGLGVTSLAAGGATTVSVTLQESTGILYQQLTTITFSSTCTALGTATIDASVDTSTGIAVSNYVATGCSGADTITAMATINGVILTATGSVTVAAAALGSIQFISTNPTSIALQGTGGAGLSESSTVLFKVIDTTGGPVSGQDVTFSLNTMVGGLSLTPMTATSGADGSVQTVIQSGTIATSVRVTATITSVGISTQSDQLVITTGIPDQDSFSLSATKLNPEALNYDGELVVITARLADRFNNPVPDGTAVTFSTEGGSIEGSCVTTSGACSVNWISQNPRPCGQVTSSATVQLDPMAGPNVCIASGGTNAAAPAGFQGLGQPYGGRVTIIATAVGEESFSDVNGNGVFDDGDFHTDLPEAYRDDNEDNSQNGTEQFLDFNVNGSYDGVDGTFNGVLCNRSIAPLCGSSTTVHVRQNLVLVMSGSFAVVSSPDITVANGGSTSGSVLYSDIHNQPLPDGTTAGMVCSIGSIVAGGSDNIGSTNYNGSVGFGYSFKGPATVGGDSGVCTVTIATPKNNTTLFSFSVTESP